MHIDTTATTCYQCAVIKTINDITSVGRGMKNYGTDMDGDDNTLIQCDDCKRFFCHTHADPLNHVHLIGKSETCAARTNRLARVLRSESVMIPGRRSSRRRGHR